MLASSKPIRDFASQVEGNAGPEAGMIERNGASMMIDVRDTVTAGTHLSEVFLSV